MAQLFPTNQKGPLEILRPKDPQEVVTHEIDWAGDLATGELIDDSVWTLTGAGLVKEADGILAGQLGTNIVLSGGNAGSTYLLNHHIITNQGLEFERSFRLIVRQR